MEVLEKLQKLQNNYNLRTLLELRHEGKFVWKHNKKLLNLASNDYLNIANNNIITQEFLENLEKEHYLFSSSSSRSLSGNFQIYGFLESYIASLFHEKSCLLFNSGYHLNISCIQALSTLSKTLFIADKFIHASMIDGLRVGKSHFKRFSHNNISELENLIEQYQTSFEHIIILIESLYSMDGDFAKLEHIIALKKRYSNVYIYLDEAHSIGVIGSNGLGLANKLEVAKDIDFLVFTFGKAIGSIGACILCKEIYKDFFINYARGLIYSTALPPINIAFSMFIFKKLPLFKQEREKLLVLSNFLKMQLQKKGLDVLGGSHIISILFPNNATTIKIAQKLENKGFFAPAIKEPTVPKGKPRIRFSLHSGLEKEELIHLVDSL